MFDYKVKKGELTQYSGDETQLILPSKILTIGKSAFFCSIIEDIDLNQVRTIKEYAFNNCHNLKNVKLNQYIRNIPKQCFGDCHSLEKVEIPFGLKEIGELAFCDCIRLNNISLPNSVIKLNQGCFSGSGIVNFSLPKSIEYLAEGVFEECKRLVNVEIKGKLKKLNDSLFQSCINLKNINLPNSLTYINPYCFYGCQSLENIELPYNLEEIGNSAFSMSGLKKIDLTNIKEIQSQAFKDCKNLKTVILDDNILYLSNELFRGCNLLNNVTIPSSVELIEKGCFCNCSSLDSIVIPKGVKLIESNAFSYNKKLKNVTIENENTLIDPNAFNMCYNLEKITYKDTTINVKNFKCGYLDNNLLLFIYNHKDLIEKLKAPISIDTLKMLKDSNLFEEYLNNAYYKNYNSLYKTFLDKSYNHLVNKEEQTALFKIAYNMGVFDRSTSQKSSELIMLLINNGKINKANIVELFEDLPLQVLDKEIIDNLTRESGKFFKDLIDYSRNDFKFFSKCINNYNQVQDTNKSKSFDHHQLRPTAKKFFDYFSINKFNHVNTKDEKKLAIEIGKFFSDQQVYNKGKIILDRFKKDKVIRSLISQENRKEIIDKLDLTNKEIVKSKKELDNLLKKVYYEFLNKDDPLNLTVGCYCNNCCAHIEGVGEDIAFASMLDSKTQTVVLRNIKESIVSKATFNINNHNDIVINSIQLNKALSKGNEENIVNKYIQCFKTFIKDYKKHYNIDINNIYISVKYSKLLPWFPNNGLIEDDVEVLDYSTYALDATYSGDSDSGFRCIYKNAIENKNKKNRKKEVSSVR